MVSMKDIALRCGVSMGTVSKALNGRRDVGEETRQQILAAAKELGYTANSAARALKTNRSYCIGIVFTDLSNSGFMHEYFASTLNSFRQEAERRGYDITFIHSNVGPGAGSYLQHCLYRGIDGVVIASVDFTAPMVIELVNSGLPVVTIDHVFNNRIAVISDNIQGMEQLTRYVIEKGHRKLAFIHGEETTVTENRLTGFHRACAEAKISIPEEWMRRSPFHDSEGCYHVTKELLSGANRPTCIFFPDDYSSIGAVNAIHDLGLRIPEDISAVGYDGIALSQMLSPRLTTWQQDTKELGRLAAASLVELIESPKTAILDRHIVHGRLLEGESVSDLR